MHILVIGAGVTGLAAAWYLRADGHEVTVVERGSGVALQASHANGGQLSYNYVAPLAAPGVLAKLPSWLLRADAPVRFRPKLDPSQWRWLFDFLCACNRSQSEQSTRRLLQLAFLSRDLMRDLVATEHKLAFDYANSGKLVVHREPNSYKAARRLMAYQRTLGCEQEALDAAACVTLEPALAGIGQDLAGGIFTPGEDSGDCFKFCESLFKLLSERGVVFKFNTDISRLVRQPDGRVAAFVQHRQHDADHIVVASGIPSAALIKSLDLRLPLYPIQGYSLTIPVATHAVAPAVSVTDYDRKVVYARLGDRLRVAGMADIVGRTLLSEPARLMSLRQEAVAMFPLAGDFSNAQTWCGQRPATPTSMPVIGPTQYVNLWLSAGQGALGFTLSLGSGRVIADLIGARTPEIGRFHTHRV